MELRYNSKKLNSDKLPRTFNQSIKLSISFYINIQLSEY